MAQNVVEILIRARDGATKPLSEVKESVKAVGVEARAGVRPLKEYREELQHQARELEAAARAQEKTSEEYRTTVAELARVKGELKGVTEELQTQQTALDRVASGLSRWGTGLTLGVTAPLTALAGVGVKSAMQLETFGQSLRVLIGDADRAQAVFEELYEFSANTPFDWTTLTEGTRVLTAFGVEAEDTVATLSRIGDIAAGTQSDLTGLAEIYGRVMTTGRLSMQEVNSLALRGVPIYQELARVIGVSTEEVRDFISEGTLGFPELQAVFTNLTSEGGKFFGMMDAQADTVAGRLGRLRDSFEQVTDLVGERLLPVVDRLIGAAQSATDWFVNLDDSTQDLFVGLGIALAAAGPVLVGLGTLLVQLPRITAAFTLLRGALLPLAGPLGLLAGVAAGAVWLNSALDAGREPRRLAQESFDSLVQQMATYRSELVITSEAERLAAVEALNRQRRVLEVTIQNQEAFIRSVEADVIAFANKGFFGQLFSFGEANVNIKTLEQAEEHLKGLRGELTAIDSSIENIATMVIPGPDTDVPTFTAQVVELGDAAAAVTDLGDPTEAVQSWLGQFVTQLQAGVTQAKAGWRDSLTSFGVLTGTILRDAFGVDQPESELVTLGKAIVGSIADGMEQAFPSLFTRISAAVEAGKDFLAGQTFAAHVASGASLRTPTSDLGPLRSSEVFVPAPIGIGGRPNPGDVAGFTRNLTQMSEAMFGPRSAPGRFLADLERMFARAEREESRATRVSLYQARAAQDARFDSAGVLAYHDRAVFDPRSAGFWRDLPQPGAFAVMPEPRDLAAPGAFATLPAARDLTTPEFRAEVQPDRSQLPQEKLTQILQQELEERQKLVTSLTTMSTENGPLANFGTQLLNAASNAVPAFGAALDGFVQAGPIGAIIGFFSELLFTSIPMQQAFAAINDALKPLGELLGHVLAPALKVLGTVVGWVVDALIAVYNFLLGWLFGPYEKGMYDPPAPPEAEPKPAAPRVHSGEPPSRQEMNFGQVAPGVQMAVATPLVEAAQLQMTAAGTLQLAASGLASSTKQFGEWVQRLVEEGISVKLSATNPASAPSQTAYLR